MQVRRFFADRTNAIAFVLALIGAFMLIPPVFELTLDPTPAVEYMGSNIDSSWIMALNYGRNHNVTWGENFEFTYGPLFYLSTRFGWGCSKYAFLFHDIFLSANFFAAFFITYKRSASKILAAMLIVAVILITPAYIGGGNALVWYFLLIFWMFQNMNRPHWGYYTVQIVILALLFYLKFNTGLISFVLFYAALSYIFIFRKDNRWRVVAYALAPVLLVLALAPVFNVALEGYIVSGFHMVSGYNEIMYTDLPETESMRTMAYVYILLFGIVLLAAIVNRKRFTDREWVYKSLVLLFVSAVGLFVLYKQAFVRAGVGHMLDFFRYTTLLVFCIGIFSRRLKLIWAVPAMLVLVLLPLYVGISNGTRSFATFSHKIDKSLYFKDMMAFTPTSGFHLVPNNNQIPAAVKSKIGNATIDVYPWNVATLVENELNYLPRPALQSYVAYTKYLENDNFEHYNGPDAPEFVLYTFETRNLDDRYCLFDEPKLHLALLKNYTAEDVFDLNGVRFLLLRKKKDFRPVQLKFIREYAMYTDAPIIPKEGIYYEIGLYKTLGATIESIVKHTPPVKLQIWNGNSVVREYKTAPPILETGIFSATHIETTDDFLHLLKNDSVAGDKHVKYYKIKPLDSDKFKNKIRIKEYKIN